MGPTAHGDDQVSVLPMRGWRRLLLLAEIAIFFGPAAGMAFAGLLSLGPSMTLSVQKLLGMIEPVNDIPWFYALQPVLLSIGAWAGLFSLLDVARTLLVGSPRLAYPPRILLLMAFAGVAAIVVFGVQVAPHEPTSTVVVLCVYAPLLATAHMLILSRRLFFSSRPSV